MTEATLWLTDDCCPACGELLRQRIQADGSVTEECGCSCRGHLAGQPGRG